MASHNRSWIWGRNTVLETLRAGRWPILELLIGEGCEPESRAESVALATRLGVSPGFVSDAMITKVSRSEEHQGLAARMPPFPYREVDELVQTLPPNAVLVLLDRVHDSYNFGAIVRSAEVLGIDGVIIGTREQGQVNSLAARSSAGAVNHVPIARTEDLLATTRKLSAGGFQVIGTSDRGVDSIFAADFRPATLLVIGNEGRGIQPELEALCSRTVRIPVLGTVSSLNAAVSAGILFYEVQRQRNG